MPSRRVVALIAAFWVLTTAFVAYRDVWPFLFASGPPPVAIDLADEAAQNVSVRWSIHIGGQKKPGRLATQMKYHDSDDTFSFVSRYTDLRYEISGSTVTVPELKTVIRVTRGGDLREQSLDGRFELHLGKDRFEATAKVHGVVTNSLLVADCDVASPFGNLKKTLDPVPVPRGQPLNPMQPVNRIADLHPGRRWIVYESDPLRDSIAALVRAKLAEYGLQLPEEKREPIVGEVLSHQQVLEWHANQVNCWLIEYRRDEVVARTWVRAADGKVLKHEAYQKGETLSIVREEY